jgi:predicted Zn-ribbon and HTH transcriptional regulator
MMVTGISPKEELQLKTFGISTLEGLKGVSVYVKLLSNVTSELKTEEYLQTLVEQELRKAGIKVFSDTDPNIYVARLFVEVTVFRRHTSRLEAMFIKPFYYCTVTVHLLQDVVLVRNLGISTKASTWPYLTYPSLDYAWPYLPNTPICSARSKDGINKLIRGGIIDDVKNFCDDFLAANSPKQPVGQKQIIDSIFREKMVWVLCRNPDCEASYQMGMKTFFKTVKERLEPMSMQVPALLCNKCGEPSVYRAAKCEKCGLVFERGSLGVQEFADRCPDCGYSAIEEGRKRRATERK